MADAPDAYRLLTERLPCGRMVGESLPDRTGVWFVGGAVRDALLGREPREIDLVTTRPVGELAAALGETVEEHERFGTVKATDGACHFDIARARSERYPAPGALPEVSFVDDIALDLRRRDFTINAIAISLADGELIEFPGALDDLDARVLRVLHDGSFVDDPTRMWRMVRYAVRLGFTPGTPLRPELIQTVSGDRVGAELRLALAEPSPLATLDAAIKAGLAPLRLDGALAAAALELAPPGARPDLVILGCCADDTGWLEGLGLTAAELAVIRAAAQAPPAVGGRPSQIAQALRDLPDEAVAVAGARGDRAAAERWLLELRGVELEISGDDLLAAGLKPGPEIGARLRRALDAKLDGMVRGRDQELAEALR